MTIASFAGKRVSLAVAAAVMTVVISGMPTPANAALSTNYDVAVELARAKKVENVIERANTLYDYVRRYIMETGDLHPTVEKINARYGLSSDVWKNFNGDHLTVDLGSAFVKIGNVFSRTPSDVVEKIYRNSPNLAATAVIDGSSLDISIPLKDKDMTFAGIVKKVEASDTGFVSEAEPDLTAAPEFKDKMWYKPDGSGGFALMKYDDGESKWKQVGVIRNDGETASGTLVVSDAKYLKDIDAEAGTMGYVKEGDVAKQYVCDGNGNWSPVGNSGTAGFDDDAKQALLDDIGKLIDDKLASANLGGGGSGNGNGADNGNGNTGADNKDNDTNGKYKGIGLNGSPGNVFEFIGVKWANDIVDLCPNGIWDAAKSQCVCIEGTYNESKHECEATDLLDIDTFYAQMIGKKSDEFKFESPFAWWSGGYYGGFRYGYPRLVLNDGSFYDSYKKKVDDSIDSYGRSLRLFGSKFGIDDEATEVLNHRFALSFMMKGKKIIGGYDSRYKQGIYKNSGVDIVSNVSKVGMNPVGGYDGRYTRNGDVFYISVNGDNDHWYLLIDGSFVKNKNSSILYGPYTSDAIKSLTGFEPDRFLIYPTKGYAGDVRLVNGTPGLNPRTMSYIRNGSSINQSDCGKIFGKGDDPAYSCGLMGMMPIKLSGASGNSVLVMQKDYIGSTDEIPFYGKFVVDITKSYSRTKGYYDVYHSKEITGTMSNKIVKARKYFSSKASEFGSIFGVDMGHLANFSGYMLLQAGIVPDYLRETPIVTIPASLKKTMVSPYYVLNFRNVIGDGKYEMLTNWGFSNSSSSASAIDKLARTYMKVTDDYKHLNVSINLIDGRVVVGYPNNYRIGNSNYRDPGFISRSRQISGSDCPDGYVFSSVNGICIPSSNSFKQIDELLVNPDNAVVKFIESRKN